LYQPPNGYRYNSDSIFLYDFISRFKPRGEVLDVGSGAGILGLLIARDFDVRMSIIDKQEHLIKYARHNYLINDLNVDAFAADFAEFDPKQRYNYIISNPPFYDSAVIQSTNESLNISRYIQHLPLETLIHSAKKLLAPKGYFVFCYDAKQIDKVFAQLHNARLNPVEIRMVHPKTDREAKIALIAARANSKAMLRVLPPLIVFDDNNNYLPEAQAAFDQAATHVISAERAGG